MNGQLFRFLNRFDLTTRGTDSLLRLSRLGTAVVASLAFLAVPAHSQQPIKVGMITSLSGSAGYGGEDLRDGMQLAIDSTGANLQIVAQDDGMKPGQAKQIADRYLKTDNIKILTGIIFGNIAAAVVPDAIDAGAIYISPNTGAARFAGKECNKSFFVTSFQNDSQGEAAGALARELGYKKVFLVAPNYAGAKEAIAAFKLYFKGEIAGEMYTRLDQTDFAVEMAAIRDAKPDVVHAFEPGGLGIAFLRQYHQAGLTSKIPMVAHIATMDQTIVKSVGEIADGIYTASHWNDDFDNEANKKFVAAWKAKYGDRTITGYAQQGYDTGLLLASAMKAVGGKLDDMDAFRAALRKADFVSVRGAFKFGPNQHPIQDWYALKAVKKPNGEWGLKTEKKVLSNHADRYAAECSM